MEAVPLLIEDTLASNQNNYIRIDKAIPLIDEESQDGIKCEVCYEIYSKKDFHSLLCDHLFCKNCVYDHLSSAIERGDSLRLPCMQQDCDLVY